MRSVNLAARALPLAAAPLLLNLPAGADDLIPWCASGDVSVGKARLAVGGLGSGDLQVEWSSGSSGGKVQGTRAVFRSDFTAQAPLDNLPSDSLINYRASIGKNQIDGLVTAYVCRGPVCGLGVTDVAALREQLA